MGKRQHYCRGPVGDLAPRPILIAGHPLIGGRAEQRAGSPGTDLTSMAGTCQKAANHILRTNPYGLIPHPRKFSSRETAGLRVVDFKGSTKVKPLIGGD
jgi:hypothetical protein